MLICERLLLQAVKNYSILGLAQIKISSDKSTSINVILNLIDLSKTSKFNVFRSDYMQLMSCFNRWKFTSSNIADFNIGYNLRDSTGDRNPPASRAHKTKSSLRFQVHNQESYTA